MSRFSNLLINFAEDFLMASLQISAYWSSESDHVNLYGLVHYKVADFQRLDKFYLVK